MPPEKPQSSSSPITADIAVIAVIFFLLLAVFGVFLKNILGGYSNILDWFYSQNWASIYTTIKYIIIAFDIVLAGFLWLTLSRFVGIQKGPVQTQEDIHVVPIKEEIRGAWEQIQRLSNSEASSDWNMAILRADALLDNILRDLGYDGDTIADRLKIVDTHKLTSIEQVWSAHRLRNIIAHDPMTQHTKETVAHALKSYKKALEELDVLGEIKENKPPEPILPTGI